MSRDFLSNFETLHKPKNSESDEDQPIADNGNEVEYPQGDYSRCIFFVWPDGKTDFIDYHRLGGGSINTEQTELRLDFGATIVELLGIRLEPLFKSIAAHNRKYVYCDDARYNDLENNDPVVNEITIIQNT